MMKKNIVIIGAGQLGSRHLQGLKGARLNMSIYVIDTNVEALNIAETRYNEVEVNSQVKSIQFITNIDELSCEIDLAIIATSSSPRAAITKQLITRRNVKNIVFEKVLFPKISQYEDISDLLKEKNVKAWVNCPRRIFQHYKELSALLSNKKNIKMEVIGGDWGLGCNSIHFIDIFAYITNDTSFNFETKHLEIQESKRAGYIEFTGEVSGCSDNGNCIKLISIKGDTRPVEITIKYNNIQILLSEYKNLMLIKNEGKSITQEIVTFFQSQLTGLIVEEIFHQNVSLTPFEDSKKLHIAILKPLISFYNKKNNSIGDLCPIT